MRKRSWVLDRTHTRNSLRIGDLVVGVETVETSESLPDAAELRLRRRLQWRLWRLRRYRALDDALRPLASGHGLELVTLARLLLDRLHWERGVGLASQHRVAWRWTRFLILRVLVAQVVEQWAIDPQYPGWNPAWVCIVFLFPYPPGKKYLMI